MPIMASKLALFLLLQQCCSLAFSANFANPMPNLDPKRVTGVWHGWKRTGRFFTNAAGCTSALLKHTGGENYTVVFVWANEDKKLERLPMNVIDDPNTKANFLFANDLDTVAMTIMDTDYENYMFFHALLGSTRSEVFYITGRKPEGLERFAERAEAVIKANEITLPMYAVNQNGCPDITYFD